MKQTVLYSYPEPHVFSIVNCADGSPSDTRLPAWKTQRQNEEENRQIIHININTTEHMDVQYTGQPKVGKVPVTVARNFIKC